MRRRAKRDLTILLGIIVIIALGLFVNYMFNIKDLAKEMDALRKQVEQERRSGGLELMDWDLLRQTKGGARSGPTFAQELLAKGGQRIDIVGFMTPLEKFREVTEFILLPLPIECYFCQMPPMRDVMLIEMAEGHKTDIFDGPVIVNGHITLNEGPNTKFFYTLKDAQIGPGKAGGRLEKKILNPDHMMPGHDQKDVPLQEGYDPAQLGE